jgi:hypothetical protein
LEAKEFSSNCSGFLLQSLLDDSACLDIQHRDRRLSRTTAIGFIAG